MKTILILFVLCLTLSPVQAQDSIRIPDIREATTDLALYECPSLTCEVLLVIPANAQMTGSEDSTKLVKGIVWTFVIYAGIEGWVNSRHLKRVQPPIVGDRYA